MIRVRCSLGLLATGRDSKAGGGLFGPGRVDSSVADMFHVPRVDEGTTVGTMFQFDDPSGEWYGVCVCVHPRGPSSLFSLMYAVRSQNVLSDVMRLFLYAWTGRSGGEEDGRRIVQFAVAYTTVSPGGDGTASSGASDGGVSVVTRHTRVLTCARRLATEAADLYRDADPVAVLYLLWHQVGLVGARVPATAVVVTVAFWGGEWRVVSVHIME